MNPQGLVIAGAMDCIGVAHVFPIGASSIGLMFPPALSLLPDSSCVPFLLYFPGILSRVTM